MLLLWYISMKIRRILPYLVAFSLVFGQTQGEDFFAGFENRARGLIKDGEMPDYHMHPSDERYFWGHTATFLAPPTKIERKHAS